LTPRLFDLQCNWLWQYACETTLFDPSIYREIPDRLRQLDGYMLGCGAAVLASGRRRDDWVRQVDPWRSLGDLVTRYQSEFAGRLLVGAADAGRLAAAPAEGLCWGMLGIPGFDFLIREPVDLERLPGCFERGVRVFGLVEGRENLLAGSAEPDDDRGLTDLGRAFLARVEQLASGGAGEPRPIVDVAHLNPRSTAEVIALASDAAAAGRLLLVYSHGSVGQSGRDEPRALGHDNLVRLRAIGGIVGLTPGPPHHATSEELKAAIETVASVPFLGRAGYEGIAIGTDFLGASQTAPGLGNVSQLTRWLRRNFDEPAAVQLVTENARRLLTRAAGETDAAPDLIP
jgi:membrane dipeptidase